MRNADSLVQKIEKTNNRLLLIVALIIFVSVVLALILVKYSVLKPLSVLSYQLMGGWSGRKSEAGKSTGKEKEVPVTFHALGELYETLHDMAIRDPLTGIYNRALMEDRIKQLIAEHRRSPACAAILLIDLVLLYLYLLEKKHYKNTQITKKEIGICSMYEGSINFKCSA